MAIARGDTAFTGSIAEMYERDLVPLIFEPYARDLCERALEVRPRRVLEIAAGTGVVTRHLAVRLAGDATLVATDLNPAMLDIARPIVAAATARAIEWQVADAMKLPFDDGQFDLVLCQFGVMFFPDKRAAFTETRRVLAPGGTLLFNVWDRIETNAFANDVLRALATCFPDDPPRFMARVPHGWCDMPTIESDLRAAGLGVEAIETVTEVSRAASADVVARAYCQGTPWRNEILERGPDRLDEATAVSAAEIRRVHGPGPVEGPIQALVVTATRPA